jgi:Double zinc ribbon
MSCGTAAPPGQKFCGNCGAALAAVCSACGSSNPPGDHSHGDQNYEAAERVFADRKLPFYLAATQLERAEWLDGQNRTADAQPLLDRARAAFEQLEAASWLDWLAAAKAGGAAAMLA